MTNIQFTGIMPALVTPFDLNGKVKENSVRNIMDWHLDSGVQGFYICGSTGEGPSLPPRTRMEMAEIAVDHAKGRGVVIDHIGASNIWDAIALTEHATKMGVDAISSLAPSYTVKYPEQELVDYYRRISDHTDKPVIVYATPALGVADFSGLMTKLLEIPNVIGVKFTIRDYFEMRKTKEVNGGNVNLINGPDETLLCGLVMGADGGIGTTYNLMPDWYVELYNAFVRGDMETALMYQTKVNHVTDILIKFKGAIRATKAALELKGYDIGNACFPARAYTEDELKWFKTELEKVGINF